MVVTCALTRFTLYIPVPSVDAETTHTTLMSRVFCVFGYPLVMITDNGPAFRSELQAHMAAFFGFRHIPILPYNAGANGTAEAAVKKIKLLLDRHRPGYKDWHQILPLAQLQMNAQVHTSHGMSPYMALFGRQPNNIELLENPALLPTSSTNGNEWLAGIRSRMIDIHEGLRLISDRIKTARAELQNRRNFADADKRVSPITVGGFVRLHLGTTEDARYARKHGHGEQWKYRYKVKAVRPHAVQLEVPKDGSVPIISEWQLIRKCEPADTVLGEHVGSATDPQLSAGGLRLPEHSQGPTPAVTDEEVYDIERVLRAERVGNRYLLHIKWKNYSDSSPLWRSDLLAQTCNPELLKEIEEAVERCRQERNVTAADDREDPLPPIARPSTPVITTTTRYGRAVRRPSNS